MVIGGYDRGRLRLDAVEEVKLNSSTENDCPVPDKFPVKISHAMGANMSEDQSGKICRSFIERNFFL